MSAAAARVTAYLDAREKYPRSFADHETIHTVFTLPGRNDQDTTLHALTEQDLRTLLAQHNTMAATLGALNGTGRDRVLDGLEEGLRA